MSSLAASFDRDIKSNSINSNCLLLVPALVQILPIVEPLTWKLVERGKITNSQIQQPATNTDRHAIENLVQKLANLNDRVVQIERGLVKYESLQALSNKQEQLQSISAKIVEQLATKQQEILALF